MNISEILNDSNFLNLPTEEKRKVLDTVDPNFTRLPSIEKDKVIDKIEEDEFKFKNWYNKLTKLQKSVHGMEISPDPDDPLHYYDYRAAYKAGAQLGPEGHMPSEFKLPGHPNQYVEIEGQTIDTITGKPVTEAKKKLIDAAKKIREKRRQKEIEGQKKVRDIQKLYLEMIACGISRREAEAEFGGITQPIYDPIDFVVDLVTGGATALTEMGLKTAAKAGAKTVGKQTAKNALVDAGLGAAVGSAMAVADKLTDSRIVTILSGLLGPIGAKAILTGSRQAAITFLRRLKKGNPKLYKELETKIKTEVDKTPEEAVSELTEVEHGL